MENNQPESGRKVVLTPVKFGGSASPLIGTGCGEMCRELPRTVKDPGMANIHAHRVEQKNDVTARLHNQLQRNMAPSMKPSGGPG